MKVTVDPTLCTACGLCEDVCPEVFVMGEEVAEVIVDSVPAEHEESVIEAEDSCPVEAITHE